MANEKRLIDANALCENIKKRYCEVCKAQGKDYKEVLCRACDIDDMCSEIDVAPTVDAVEVVRCKDCKYINRKIHAKGYGCLCDAHSSNREGHERYLYVDDGDFCSYGERRTDV